MDSTNISYVNENISLLQREGGHTFGTDAYLLYAYMNPCRGEGMELGTGTGIISLLAASSDRFKHIDALEVQPEMANIAKENVVLNHLEQKIQVIQRDLREHKGRYDTVFSNPPYMRHDGGVSNPEHTKNASRREIFGTIEDFCECASRCLNFGGSFYVVWHPERLTDLVSSMRSCDIEPKRMTFVASDIFHKPSLVLCEGKRGGKDGGLFVTPTLHLNIDNKPSEDYNYIYERGEFPERYKRP